MSDRVFNVLFLCTGNSARSVLAEAILQKDGAGKFRAFSAGSQPKGEVNPFSLRVLKSLGYPHEGFRSKSWDDFSAPDAPRWISSSRFATVRRAKACPLWLGHPTTAHWGIADPAAVEGSDMEKERAFVEAFRLMKNRISVFIALPIATLDKLTLDARLREIGRMEGATGA